MTAPDQLIGYTDAIGTEPDSTLRLMVSSPEPYTARLVRLLHGDTNSDGPGMREEVAAEFEERMPGRLQEIRMGSCAVVPESCTSAVPRMLTLATWIFPTRPGARTQAVMTRWSGDERGGRGYGLFLTAKGDLAFRVGDGSVTWVDIRTGRPLKARTWYLAVATFDQDQRVATVHQAPASSWSRHDHPTGSRASFTEDAEIVADGIPYVLAAHWRDDGRTDGHLDGKLERPTVLARAVQPTEASLFLSAERLGETPGVIAVWDFSRDISSVRVPDVSPNGWDAELINMPTRAVTGREWSGTEYDWRHSPEEYGAVHFHSDDLEDAGWEPDLTLKIPMLKSGIYALRLEGRSGVVDHVPFIVRERSPRSRVGVLLPTFTYLAYAAERIVPPFEARCEGPEDRYVTATGMLSQYNHHADGSGVAYASRLRPLPNLRPAYRYWLTGHPHGLGADLYLLDWLRHTGFEHDVLIDDDVHADGEALLRRYRVIITGSHPEYVTHREMLALGAFLEQGGRVMYLGGNGFTMVTGVHPERQHVTEIRRTLSHAGLWESEPGETHLSTTGELGGRWSQRRERTRALVGVETVGMGFHGACCYQREPDSFDSRAAFVFDGIGMDEPIGDFGLAFGAAAGYEVDGLDCRLGTPEHALLLARARGFSEGYVPLTADPDIRSDMVLFETRDGGFVFSVGSIAWTGALSHNGYQNNVARITENVLRHFADCV